jgi:hypothetical protein
MVLTFIAGVARTPILFFQGAQEYTAKSPEIPPFPNEDFCSLSSVLQRFLSNLPKSFKLNTDFWVLSIDG